MRKREMPFSQWMNIRMNMSDENWAVYQQEETPWQQGMDVREDVQQVE
jgi:hypothetical protein